MKRAVKDLNSCYGPAHLLFDSACKVVDEWAAHAQLCQPRGYRRRDLMRGYVG